MSGAGGRVRSLLLPGLLAALMCAPGGSRAAGGDQVVERVIAQFDPPRDSLATLSLSRDCRHFAFMSKVGRSRLVVRDGQRAPLYDGVMSGTPLVNPQGTHIAYGPRRRDKRCVVPDGVEGPWFTGIGERSITFSADGEHLAYIAYQARGWSWSSTAA